jgi:transposase
METESVKPTRKTYSREYKIEAVKLTTRGGLTVAQAARDLGLNENTLHKWRQQLRADSEHAFPGKGHMKPLEEENRKLRRENAILKEERDFLKRAAVWLAREAH